MRNAEVSRKWRRALRCLCAALRRGHRRQMRFVSLGKHKLSWQHGLTAQARQRPHGERDTGKAGMRSVRIALQGEAFCVWQACGKGASGRVRPLTAQLRVI